MPDFADLERRLATALDRIDSAIGAQAAAPPTDAVPAASLAEAEAARDAAQAEAAAAREAAQAAAAERDARTQALEAESEANTQLREHVAALKRKKEEQAHRIAELEAAHAALQKARDEDRAELDALIAALEPLVQEQPHA